MLEAEAGPPVVSIFDDAGNLSASGLSHFCGWWCWRSGRSRCGGWCGRSVRSGPKRSLLPTLRSP